MAPQRCSPFRFIEFNNNDLLDETVENIGPRAARVDRRGRRMTLRDTTDDFIVDSSDRGERRPSFGLVCGDAVPIWTRAGRVRAVERSDVVLRSVRLLWHIWNHHRHQSRFPVLI